MIDWKAERPLAGWNALNNRTGRQLLALTFAFVVLQGLVLTLAPAVRERSLDAPLRLTHWLGIAVWLSAFTVLQRLLERNLPKCDPYLLPLCALLSGWGILTVWRLDPSFGMRQAVWLGISAAAGAWLVSRWQDLSVLRRYRSVLLASGFALTGLTVVLGTSPTGVGPRLWLGCCGIYLQPSEPLKLLLVVYLAAYLADRAPVRTRLFPLLLPTLVIGGIALLLMLVQRDLGSASIIVLLYTLILYVATHRRRTLLAAAMGLTLAAVIGYFLVAIIHARIDSWLNPWSDPSGRSYQIIQSLLAVANGGILGRGLGIGNPGLVPVAHSDFIYAAIAEEMGLSGSLGLIGVYALLLTRGLVISRNADNRFHRLLAAGLTAHIGIQSLLIIGGDLRMLPLTGVTLPMVSYGGSSLVTSALAVAMLVTISSHPARRPRVEAGLMRPYALLAAMLGLGMVGAILVQTWWAVPRGSDLLARTDNARRSIADRQVVRGSLRDRSDAPIAETRGESGALERRYLYPALSSVVGYTNPTFGQAGLEQFLDPYLRGTAGNPADLLLWDQLLYGTPPPGLDVRLTLDLPLQERADAALGEMVGAVIVINARSGEILVMASHPTFDANNLDAVGPDLAQHGGSPLLNRATQGTYRVHNAVLPMIEAAGGGASGQDVRVVYQELGLHSAPRLRLPVSAPTEGTGITDALASPLQMAVAAATLSNEGMRPAPRIALAVNTPRQGWVFLPPLGETTAVFPPENAVPVARRYTAAGSLFWQWSVTASSAGQTLTWYLAGTQPGWQGIPLAAVVLLENANAAAATRIGSDLMAAAATP